MLLPVCSDEVLWSCRLKAVFSKVQGYGLVSLSGQWENKLQGEQGSLFVVMTQANPSPKFPGFALWIISSACQTLCSSVARLQGFQVFWIGFLVGQGQGTTLSSRCTMTELLCLGAAWWWESWGPGSRAFKVLFLRTRIRHTCASPNSLVKMCHYLGSAGEQKDWLRLLLECCG